MPKTYVIQYDPGTQQARVVLANTTFEIQANEHIRIWELGTVPSLDEALTLIRIQESVE